MSSFERTYLVSYRITEAKHVLGADDKSVSAPRVDMQVHRQLGVDHTPRSWTAVTGLTTHWLTWMSVMAADAAVTQN